MWGDGRGYMSNSLGRHQLASGTKANMIVVKLPEGTGENFIYDVPEHQEDV